MWLFEGIQPRKRLCSHQISRDGCMHTSSFWVHWKVKQQEKDGGTSHKWNGLRSRSFQLASLYLQQFCMIHGIQGSTRWSKRWITSSHDQRYWFWIDHVRKVHYLHFQPLISPPLVFSLTLLVTSNPFFSSHYWVFSISSLDPVHQICFSLIL